MEQDISLIDPVGVRKEIGAEQHGRTGSVNDRPRGISTTECRPQIGGVAVSRHLILRQVGNATAVHVVEPRPVYFPSEALRGVALNHVAKGFVAV